jgi:hypothetical protein
MKNIQPKQVFFNGIETDATQFNLRIINDNLFDSAVFYYQLFDVNSTPLVSGNLTMTNPDYDLWNGVSDINYSAYQWAATKLNITLA